MSWESIVRVIIVVFLMLLMQVKPIFAQEEGELYIVTSDQAINARQCPRLDCAIVESLEPGTELTVVDTVSGDTVFGSDQWVQVDAGGVQMYVHSALVEPGAKSATASRTASKNTLDTTDWITHQIGRLQLLAPRGWLEIGELAADEEYLAELDEVYGDGASDWVINMHQMCEDGTYDLVLSEFDGSGSVVVYHENRSSANITPRYVKRIIEMWFVDDSHYELVSADTVTLASGEAARLQFNVTIDTPSGSYHKSLVIFGIIVDEDVYYLSMAGSTDYVDRYSPLFDTIAASFDHDPSDL